MAFNLFRDKFDRGEKNEEKTYSDYADAGCDYVLYTAGYGS